MRYYAGIGSRETPSHICQRMETIATYLEDKGWCLRSGAAAGADTAFELGLFSSKTKEIFTARSVIPDKAYEMAEKFHPAWNKCSPFAKKLHARNGMILFGGDMDGYMVEFIVCWTKGGMPTGGTGQALRIAAAYEIPVFNLYFDDAPKKLHEWLKENND